jgi:hypothetical protein
MSNNTPPNPLVFLSPTPSGQLQACRASFHPIGNITPGDLFPEGSIVYSYAGRFPHVGGVGNSIWSHLISSPTGLGWVYLTDYLTWNVPITFVYEDGQLSIRHYVGNNEGVSGLRMASLLNPDKDKNRENAGRNLKTIVAATDFGFDKTFIYARMTAYNRHGDRTEHQLFEPTVGTRPGVDFWVGFVDLETKRMVSLPFPNIHDDGRICLPEPTATIASRSEMPHGPFQDFANSPANLDLLASERLENVEFSTVPESEDEQGIPWLRAHLKAGKVLSGCPELNLTLPDIWGPLDGHIKRFLTDKKKAKKK